MFYFMVDMSFWEIAFSSDRIQTDNSFRESNRFISESGLLCYCALYEERLDEKNQEPGTNTYLFDILI